MDADLDTLCTVIYCTADDLLPEARANARRRITDAELVTLCVAQAIMGIPSDRRFLAVARQRLVHLFPDLPRQAGYHKRRRRLAEAIEWLMGVFAADSPGASDELLLCDSTPIECARSRETVERSALGEVCGYGYCAAHSRWFWGVRLHALCAPDGTRAPLSWPAPRVTSVRSLELLERMNERFSMDARRAWSAVTGKSWQESHDKRRSSLAEKEKYHALAVFIAAQQHDGLSWNETREHWNRLHPEWRFGSHEVASFMRAARKAWSATADGGWTELHDKRKPPRI